MTKTLYFYEKFKTYKLLIDSIRYYYEQILINLFHQIILQKVYVVYFTYCM
jgi:hypothetical protein